MHRLIFELIKLLFQGFHKEIRTSQRRQFRMLKPDQQTKISVLNDQFDAYFTAATMEEKFQTEDYIQKIIAGMKKENKADTQQHAVLDDLLYELKFNQGNRKNINALLRKL